MKTEQFKKLTDKQKKELYKEQYLREKKTTKQFGLKFAYSTSYHIIKKLEEQDNVSAYIKSLIEKDITTDEKARYDFMQEQELKTIKNINKGIMDEHFTIIKMFKPRFHLIIKYKGVELNTTTYLNNENIAQEYIKYLSKRYFVVAPNGNVCHDSTSLYKEKKWVENNKDFENQYTIYSWSQLKDMIDTIR